jgi:hypothetical protein
LARKLERAREFSHKAVTLSATDIDIK